MDVLWEPLVVELITSFLNNRSKINCLLVNRVFHYFCLKDIYQNTQTECKRLNFLIGLSPYLNLKNVDSGHRFLLKNVGIRIGENSSKLMITSIFGNSLSRSLSIGKFKILKIINIHQNLVTSNSPLIFIKLIDIQSTKNPFVVELNFNELVYKPEIQCHLLPAPKEYRNIICDEMNLIASIIPNIKQIPREVSHRYFMMKCLNSIKFKHMYLIERHYPGHFTDLCRLDGNNLIKLLKMKHQESCYHFIVNEIWCVCFCKQHMLIYDMNSPKADAKRINYKSLNMPFYKIGQMISSLGQETVLFSRKKRLSLYNCRTNQVKFIDNKDSINWRRDLWCNDGYQIYFKKQNKFHSLTESQLWDMW